MSKVYEALQHALKERKQVEQWLEAPHPEQHIPTLQTLPRTPSSIDMDAEMLGLAQSISSRLADPTKNIVQFIGTQKGEGTSTIVWELARVFADRGGKSVLVIDSDSINFAQHHAFGMQPKTGLEEVAKKGIAGDEIIPQVKGPSRMHLGSFSISDASKSGTNSFNGIDEMLAKIRKQFDLILVDSPPIRLSANGLALSPRVDGIVLVVEAEKSRSPVVSNARDRIVQSGGNLLGIVFNKQQHHIPEWIYKRL